MFITRVFEHGIMSRGAELAYYFLFSFLPLIIFVAALISAMKIDISSFAGLEKLIPQDVLSIISEYYHYIFGAKNTGLMVSGLVLSVYFSSAAVRSLMRGLDVAYHVKENRPFIRKLIMSIFFAIILLLMISLSMVVLVAGGKIIELIIYVFPEYEGFEFMTNILRFALPVIPMLFVLTLLFMFVPNQKVKFREAIPGALFSLIAWMVVSAIFSLYVSTMGNYSVLYGSLGAIIVLMLWFYLIGIIFVMGGELNALLFEWKNKTPEPRTMNMKFLVKSKGKLVRSLQHFRTYVFPEYEGFEFMTNILRFALPVIPMLFVLTLLFMFVPNQKVKFREAIPGALFSLIAWMVVSAIFSLYVSTMGNYSVLYGSLGAIIVLMLWFYLIGIIFVMGGELNALLFEWKNKTPEPRTMNMKFLVKSKGKLVRSLQHFRTAEKDKSDKKDKK